MSRTERFRVPLVAARGLVGLALVAAAVLAEDAPGLLRAVLVAVGLIIAQQAAATLLTRRLGRPARLGTWMAAVWLVVLAVAALAEPLLPLGEGENTAVTLTEPRLLRPDLFSSHPLGTNNFGLDLLARVLAGARVSLLVAVVAAVLGLLVGGLLGVLAGYFRGGVDAVIGALTDTVLAFPALVLLLAVASVVEPTLITLSLALAFLTVPVYTRLAKANTVSVAQREFVEAARSMGASDRRVIAFEVVPNVIQPLLSYAMVSLSVLIVAESSLSFLGLGVAPPAPTWGNMIAEGNGGMVERSPHLVLVPGLALFLTVLSLNLVGEWARLRWDPMRRQAG